MNVNNPRIPTALVDEKRKSLYVLHPTIQNNSNYWYVAPFTINQYCHSDEENINFILHNMKSNFYELEYIPKSGNYKNIYLKS